MINGAQSFYPHSNLRASHSTSRVGTTITLPASHFQSTIIDEPEKPANAVTPISLSERQEEQNLRKNDGVLVTLSKEANEPLRSEKVGDDHLVYSKQPQNARSEATSETTSEGPSESQNTLALDQALTSAEVEQVKALKERDAEVKRHEQAHAAAGGATTGAPSYTYTTGPDGRQYAVAGEVSVRFSSKSDPEKVIAEAKQIKRAATAPAEPSAQDYAVAREADQRIAYAQQELIERALEAKTEAAGNDTSISGFRPQGSVGSGEDDQQEQLQAAPKHLSARGYSDEDVEKIQTGEAFFAVA